jgi:hypothetical protein
MSGEGADRDRVTPDVSDTEIEEFDDAALDNYLSEPPDDTESDKEGGDAETVDTTDDSPPEGTEGGDDVTAEGQPDAPDELTLLKEKVEALGKQVKDKEQYIQERGREIGDLRKALRERADGLRESVQDSFVDDPASAVQRILEAERAEQEIRSLDLEEATTRNKAEIEKAIPDFESKLDSIAEIAKADGVPAAAIRNFRDNPYATSPKILMMLADRADKAAKVRELSTKVEELTAKQKSIAQKIAEAAGKNRVVTGKAGGKTSSDEDPLEGVTEDSLHDLPDDLLDKFLEQEG